MTVRADASGQRRHDTTRETPEQSANHPVRTDLPWDVLAASGTTSAARSTAALQEIVDGVAAGRYRPNLERRFPFDGIVAAHRFMEENRGSGKLVVVVDG